ncbi:cysteine-rich secretory protein family protein [Peptococcaceae bacterium CEB3]|nr:cysteine-rich secretory protein family protein [Peptococcaceae bacterium CEB3]
MRKIFPAIILSLILLDPVFTPLWQRTAFMNRIPGLMDRIPQTAQKVLQPPLEHPGSSAPRVLFNLPLSLGPASSVSQTQITAVEHKVLALINQERQAAGLRPVVWDETAARAARQHVQEEADNGYISHWGMNGMKPQERYTLVGGLNAVEENESVSFWSNGGFHGVSEGVLYDLVRTQEVAMVNERPPDDGHRKNILDPHHTGVGITIAVGKYGVAMAEEFTNHYADLKPLPYSASQGSDVTLTGRIFPGYEITGVYAVWEQLPQPMTRAQLMQTHSYSDPPFSNLHFWARPGGRGYYIQTSSGDIFAKNIVVGPEGEFSLTVPLTDRPALDYITLEIAPKGNPQDRFYAGQFVVRH